MEVERSVWYVLTGLVIADFYKEIAEAIEDEAMERISDCDVEHIETIHMPGIYDTPLAADRLARQESIHAVAVLGPVITGDTDHDQVIAHSTAQKLSDISLNRDTPITFDVSGPNMSTAEARERIGYCADAVDAALAIVDALPEKRES